MLPVNVSCTLFGQMFFHIATHTNVFPFVLHFRGTRIRIPFTISIFQQKRSRRSDTNSSSDTIYRPPTYAEASGSDTGIYIGQSDGMKGGMDM